MLIAGVVNTINAVVTNGIHATGEIAKLSIGAGTIYLLTLPATYILFSQGLSAQYCYIVMLVAHIITLIHNCIVFKHLVAEFNIVYFLFQSLLRCFGAAIPALIVLIFATRHINSDLLSLIVSSVIFLTLYSLIAFYVALDNGQRQKIKEFIHIRRR